MVIGHIVEECNAVDGSFLDNHFNWITGSSPPIDPDFVHDLSALRKIRCQCDQWGLKPRFLYPVQRSSEGRLELARSFNDPVDWYDFWQEQEAAAHST